MNTYYIAGYPITDELYHHGIKGQKWGIRRYQNPDGSLTAAGRARYGTIENFNNAQAYKNAKKEYSKAYDKAYSKNLGSFSPVKAHREASIKRWGDVYDKAVAAENARKKYRESKASVQNMPEVKARNEKIRKALIVGGSVAAAAAVSYGAYKFAQANPEMISAGKERIRQLLSGNKNVKVKAELDEMMKRGSNEAFSEMTKKSMEGINQKHQEKTSGDLSDMMKRGSSEAFSNLTKHNLDAVNKAHEGRGERIGEATKKVQEAARERSNIMNKQFQETYKIMKDQEKEMRRKKKKGK